MLVQQRNCLLLKHVMDLAVFPASSRSLLPSRLVRIVFLLLLTLYLFCFSRTFSRAMLLGESVIFQVPHREDSLFVGVPSPLTAPSSASTNLRLEFEATSEKECFPVLSLKGEHIGLVKSPWAPAGLGSQGGGVVFRTEEHGKNSPPLHNLLPALPSEREQWLERSRGRGR